MMSEDTLAEAEKHIHNIRTLNVRIQTGGSTMGYEHEKAIQIAIDGFTRSKATNDGKALTWALSVIQEYTWLAVNGNVSQTDNFQSYYEYSKKRADKLEEEKKQLKKDNEELIEKYYKLQGKTDYVTAEFGKLLERLADSYKKAHTP